MKITLSNILITIAICLVHSYALAQEIDVFKKFDEYRKLNFQEKVYVSTDREFYLAGEIIWFKVYGLDGSLHLPTDISKIAYIEVISADSTAQLQAKVELNDGCGSGSFYIPTSVASGRYMLRAYTNWMKNYDATFFFQKELTIINTFKQLPQLPKSNGITLDFYPEGGHLVSGIESNVAFQVGNMNDKEINFTGFLVNSIGDTILSFSPKHAGMGSFKFVPEKGVSYRAVLYSGKDLVFKELPEVEEFGFVLSLQEQDDQVMISAETNTDESEIYLLVHGRNIASHALNKKLSQGKAAFSIHKKDLVEGINHFTVFNEDQKPVAERLFFRHPQKLMSIDIKKGESSQSVKQTINYNISTPGYSNSNLSMSVFKLDSLNQEPSLNIVDYLYLSSDLKGYTNSQSYHVSDQRLKEDIDLLMMVHGWSRFSWEDVMKPKKASAKKFVPEIRGHLIQGQITSKQSGIAAERINGYLSVLGDYPRFYVSRSDSEGRIKFELQDSYGKADIVISSNQMQDRNYIIEIWDAYSKEFTPIKHHPFQIDEHDAERLIARSVGMQALNIYQEKEINSFQTPNADTSLFFMKQDKRYMLDDFTRFSTMEDIMREYMPEVFVNSNREGFSLSILDRERDVKYKDNPLVLYDGVPLFDINKFMAVDPHKIKSIDIVRKRYLYGKSTFDGIISCFSYNRDLEGCPVDPNSLLMKYEFAQRQRSFYSPDYRANISRSTPDRRNLLFWNANIATDENGIAKVEFSTSEETGHYLVVVEGMSSDGIPGYTSFAFEVKEELN